MCLRYRNNLRRLGQSRAARDCSRLSYAQLTDYRLEFLDIGPMRIVIGI